MSHKSLVSGTSYDISGGRVLISGVGYDITSGRTVMNGTSKDIVFGNDLMIYDGGVDVLEGSFQGLYSGIYPNPLGNSTTGTIAGGCIMTCGYAYNGIHPTTGAAVRVYSAAWGVISVIDFTDYTTLHAIACVNTSNTSLTLGVSDNSIFGSYLEHTTCQAVGLSNAAEISIDISGLTGEGCIKFSTMFDGQATPGYGYITKLWLT